MIYTLTLNPALDHIVRLDYLDLGQTNRMDQELIKAGGKGINVTKLLKNLGMDSVILGYVGGFTGDELERILVKDQGLWTDFIHVQKGFTRINVKIKAGLETEINGPGLDISIDEIEALYKKLDQIEDGAYLLLSGSIPKSLGVGFYKDIMERLKEKSIKIIVDASGKALEATLALRPFLVKPNLRELEEIFGLEIKEKKEISFYAKKLQDLGAKNIMVSLGKVGAYMVDISGKEYFIRAPEGKLVDSVGSGDSMVAGFVYGIEKGFSFEDILKFSVACGSATAFSENIGTREEIYKLYKKM